MSFTHEHNKLPIRIAVMFGEGGRRCLDVHSDSAKRPHHAKGAWMAFIN